MIHAAPAALSSASSLSTPSSPPPTEPLVPSPAFERLLQILLVQECERLVVDLCTQDGASIECLLFDGHLADRIAFPLRPILHRALELDARLMWIAHNHPSGNPHPSAADLMATRLLHRTVAPLGILLHDHVIVARNGIISFRASGML